MALQNSATSKSGSITNTKKGSKAFQSLEKAMCELCKQNEVHAKKTKDKRMMGVLRAIPGIFEIFKTGKSSFYVDVVKSSNAAIIDAANPKSRCPKRSLFLKEANALVDDYHKKIQASSKSKEEVGQEEHFVAAIQKVLVDFTTGHAVSDTLLQRLKNLFNDSLAARN